MFGLWVSLVTLGEDAGCCRRAHQSSAMVFWERSRRCGRRCLVPQKQERAMRTVRCCVGVCGRRPRTGCADMDIDASGHVVLASHGS